MIVDKLMLEEIEKIEIEEEEEEKEEEEVIEEVEKTSLMFSCVICTYNPKLEWLMEAVNSAYGLFDEIIIVDDGSNFRSPVFDHDGVVVYRHEVNKGLYEAKNTGVKNASGDMICFLDDDDFFDHDGVIALKNYIEDNPVYDIYSFPLRMFGEVSGIYGVGKPEELFFRNSIPGVSWFKRSIWKELGGFTEPTAEDWDFAIRMYLAGKTFCVFDMVVYNNRRYAGSVSSNWTGERFEEIKNKILSKYKK